MLNVSRCLTACCLLLAIASSKAEAGVELFNYVVARVDDDIVTLFDLEIDAFLDGILQATQHPRSLETSPVRIQAAIPRRILEMLVLLDLAALGLHNPHDDELNNVEALAAFAGMIRSAPYSRQLAAWGLPEAVLRKKFLDKLAVRDFLDRHLETSRTLLDEAAAAAAAAAPAQSINEGTLRTSAKQRMAEETAKLVHKLQQHHHVKYITGPEDLRKASDER